MRSNVLLLMTLVAGTEAFAPTSFVMRPAASPPLRPLHVLRGGTVQSSLAGVLSGAMAVPAARQTAWRP